MEDLALQSDQLWVSLNGPHDGLLTGLKPEFHDPGPQWIFHFRYPLLDPIFHFCDHSRKIGREIVKLAGVLFQVIKEFLVIPDVPDKFPVP